MPFQGTINAPLICIVLQELCCIPWLCCIYGNLICKKSIAKNPVWHTHDYLLHCFTAEECAVLNSTMLFTLYNVCAEVD